MPSTAVKSPNRFTTPSNRTAAVLVRAASSVNAPDDPDKRAPPPT